MTDKLDMTRDAATPDRLAAIDSQDKRGSIEVLDDLIETCRDGEQGFDACAEYLDVGMLKRRFYQRAAACRAAADELIRHARRLGGHPNDGGAVRDAASRGWLAMQEISSKHTEQALLEACERGEDVALTRYRKAFAEALPPDIKSLVKHQLQDLLKSHDEIKMLREEANSHA